MLRSLSIPDHCLSPQVCPAGTRASEAWGTCSGLKGPAGQAPCVGLAPWGTFFLSLVLSRQHTSWRTWCPSAHLPASTVSYLIPLLRYLKARLFSFFLFFFQNIYLFIWLQRVAAPGIFHCGAFSAALRLSYPVACETLVPPPGGESASPTLESRFLTTGPPRKSPGSFPARNPSRILSLRACHLSFSWALSLVTPWVRLCLKLCSVGIL